GRTSLSRSAGQAAERDPASGLAGTARRRCWELPKWSPGRTAAARHRPARGVRSLHRRVGVLDQLLELGLEPLAGQRGVRQGTGEVATVGLLAAVEGRVAHRVGALAFVVRDL